MTLKWISIKFLIKDDFMFLQTFDDIFSDYFKFRKACSTGDMEFVKNKFQSITNHEYIIESRDLAIKKRG